MKKYFLGVVAVVFAIAFSAFTKPEKMFATKQFKFNTTSFTQSSVQTLSNWIDDQTSLTCSGDQVKACTIVVDEQFYHIVEGDAILNDAAFIATNRTGTADASDQVASIVAEQGTVTGKFRVAPSTTATSIDNQADN